MDSERILSLADGCEATRQGLAGMILDAEALVRRVDLEPGFRIRVELIRATLQVVGGHLLSLLEPIDNEVRQAKVLAECDSTILEK